MATPTPPQYVRDDYDGDGITDVAVYETAIGYVAVYNEITGQWSYRRSSDDALAGTTLGGPGFLAVPADFGGGGKADVAVYQVRNGAWTYIASSTGMQVSLGTFGAARFAPVPADYDGDGKVDAGAYRKSSGGWRYRSSWTGMKTSLPTLGGTGFVPVVGIRLRCPSRGR